MFPRSEWPNSGRRHHSVVDGLLVPSPYRPNQREQNIGQALFIWLHSVVNICSFRDSRRESDPKSTASAEMDCTTSVYSTRSSTRLGARAGQNHGPRKRVLPRRGGACEGPERPLKGGNGSNEVGAQEETSWIEVRLHSLAPSSPLKIPSPCLQGLHAMTHQKNLRLPS